MTERLPKKIIARLNEARRFATMENANFGFAGDKVSFEHMGHMPGTMSVDKYIKLETRRYRETWLIPQIDAILDWSRGECKCGLKIDANGCRLCHP